MTAREALARAAERLRLAGVEDPAHEARILLEHVLGLSRAQLLARPLLSLDPAAQAAYDALVDRRTRREPLPYILGHQPFRALDLLIDPRALIPRPETELLVEMALGGPNPLTLLHFVQDRLFPAGEGGPMESGHTVTQLPTAEGTTSSPPLPPGEETGRQPPTSASWTAAASPLGSSPIVPSSRAGKGARGSGLSAVDVGTGAGGIAISLAVEAPGLHVYATDLSPDALALARENAERHGVGDRVTFLLGDLLEPLPEPVDLVVANLPYVAAADLAAQPELGWEPRLALDGGPDGLDAYRRLLAQAPGRLRPGGRLLFEIGADQGEAALSLARAAFADGEVRLHRDYAGRDRVVEVRAAELPLGRGDRAPTGS